MTSTRSPDTGKTAPFRCLSESEISKIEHACWECWSNNSRLVEEADAIVARLRRWSDEAVRWGDEAEIEIRIKSPAGPPAGVPFTIRANVYGEWAAHRGVKDQDTTASWSSVTHLPTGRALQIRLTGDQAKAIAATLAGRVPHLATVDEVERSHHLIIPAVRLVVMDAWPGARF